MLPAVIHISSETEWGLSPQSGVKPRRSREGLTCTVFLTRAHSFHFYPLYFPSGSTFRLSRNYTLEQQRLYPPSFQP